MKTYNTVAVETDINGIDSNDELTALFARALELCQTTKASEVIRCSSSSNTQYLSFPDVTYCVQHSESVDLQPIPLPEVDFNECLDSAQALCSQIKQEKEKDDKDDEIEDEKEPLKLLEEAVIALGGGQVTHRNTAHSACTEPLMYHTNYDKVYGSQELFKMNLANHNKDFMYVFGSSIRNEDKEITEAALQVIEPDKHIPATQNYVQQDIDQRERDQSQNLSNKQMGKKQHICPYCDRNCRSNSALEIHIMSHTQERPYQCEQCGKAVTTAAILRVHTRRHLGDKPFKCTLCDRAFVTKQELKEHMAMHTGEKPYKCELCGKAFTRKDKLTQHLRIHTGERPHKCEYCNVAFVSKGNLNKHLQKHSKERPHKCERCEKAFMMRHDLRRHLLIHSGERPHKCEICGKAFIRKDKLLQHLRVHWKKSTST